MRARRPIRHAGALVAALAVASAAAACGQPSTTPSTTTTTTLPRPVAVLSTTPSGAAAFEGPVYRVAVTPLPKGSITPPARTVPPGVITATVKLAYRQFGSGPNLVLAAGEHASMTWWDPQFLQALAQHYRVTIFDPPAIGYSASLKRAPSVETDGDMMADLIAALGLTNATLVGWGMGGEAALSLVERHPGLIIGLVLVDSTAGGPGATRPSAKIAEIMGSPTSTLAMLSHVMFPPTRAGETARRTWLDDIGALEPDVVTFQAISGEAGAQRVFFVNRRVARHISEVRLPTLVYAGAKDVVIPAENSRVLAKEIPHATLVIDPDGGYAALFQNSTKFFGALARFVSRVTVATTTTTVP